MGAVLLDVGLWVGIAWVVGWFVTQREGRWQGDGLRKLGHYEVRGKMSAARGSK